MGQVLFQIPVEELTFLLIVHSCSPFPSFSLFKDQLNSCHLPGPSQSPGHK